MYIVQNKRGKAICFLDLDVWVYDTLTEPPRLPHLFLFYSLKAQKFQSEQLARAADKYVYVIVIAQKGSAVHTIMCS